ncbi:phosphate:acyl-[acyl carrier protein] acyltransferase [Cetobacterium ceti]|uniref:Phosphate acyltransferase n=1 Tax=Cetobacterium ceti TaxID=180163 RepID=A0A1T4L079_9FUSO|nr:phosphate acyltransferase PlsX [Cetobacterium ceti]SJZ48099.1 phosphate:acyl-[acyl carrier protein] acyltransferase [Cetobacterium ceti]
MKIALDAMGGDFAPAKPVLGAIEALKEISDLEIILVGKKELIEEELKKNSYTSDRIEIKDTCDIIEMDEDPVQGVRSKPKASMNVMLDLVKSGEADASVSGGNTGALITASQLKLRRIKGVLRPAIATVFPAKNKQIVFMDVGANADCKPEFINQFSLMGSVYAKELLDIENPKVGLLNIGTEEGKGNEITRESFELLKKHNYINFYGNIESRDMMNGEVDVVVTDGFTGNMVLKASEGVAKFIFDFLKEEIGQSFRGKIGALLLKPIFKKMKKRMDSSEYGGAIFLGLNGISIKAHGNSDENGFKNAIKVANKFAKDNFIEQVKVAIDKCKEEKNEF